MKTRMELHDVLCEDLGSRNCYYSPPSNIRMEYPCIVYSQEGNLTRHADDVRYKHNARYTITVISECPCDDIYARLFCDNRLRYLNEDTIYVTDGMYHHVYTLFW